MGQQRQQISREQEIRNLGVILTGRLLEEIHSVHDIHVGPPPQGVADAPGGLTLRQREAADYYHTRTGGKADGKKDAT